MRYLIFCVGVLGGVVPTITAASAATPTESSAVVTTAVEVEESGSETTYAETVVVTASVADRELGRVPASVEVIEAEEIRDRQAASVAELLATVGGLHVARSGSPGQVASLFTRGTESDHTLVLWNGVELNNPYFGGFNWAFQPTEGLDRVEIVRGPFGALYGSDAVGGVVQVLSGHRDGVDLRMEGGQNDYGRAALQAGFGTDTLRFDVSGHARRGDGELANDFYDSDELVAHLDWTLRDGVSLGVMARVNESETGIPLSGGVPSLERRIAWEESEIAVPFRFERDLWRIDAHVTLVEYDSLFTDPADAFGFTESQTESESFRARVAATRRLSGGSRVSFGVETETVEVDDRSVFGVNLAGAEQETDAVFGEWHAELGGWVVDLGARYDDNDTFGDELSPRVGLSRELGEGARVFASYGESFRAPSIGELFFPFSGNPDLQPERGRSVEVGYAVERGPWNFRLAGFENRLDDLIDFDFIAFRNVNVGEARTRGVELALGYAASNWSVRWNGTLLDTEDRGTGLDLLRRPSESSSLVVGWTPERFRLSAVARYVGERDDVDPVTFARASNGSYTVFDLAARWQARERFAPYARVENVLDREYEEVLGFPALGQTWVGGLALSF